MKNVIILLMILAVSVCKPTTIFSQVHSRYYVKAGGAGDGTDNWANASGDLQATINGCLPGDSIWVAKGTYQPASGQAFNMLNGSQIFGGFAGTETQLNERNFSADTTILSGNGNSVVSNINIDSTGRWDGFTITGGTGTPTLSHYGGGIYNINSSPVIANCVISANSAIGTYVIVPNEETGAGYGGGMYNYLSSPSVINCTFSGNYTNADDDGGLPNYGAGAGMYNNQSSPVINNCTFQGNSTTSGGGMFEQAESDGGGIYNYLSNPIITDCFFANNSATGGGGEYGAPGYGGGVANFSSSPYITNCVFTGNSANTGDGGVNYEGSYGGAIYNDGGSSPHIINSTFYGNAVYDRGPVGEGNAIFVSTASTVIANCIVWDNLPIYVAVASDSIVYNIINGGYAGTGNLTGDPLFRDSTLPAGPDGIFGTVDDGLQLTSHSPAINRGSNDYDSTGSDVAGQPRVYNKEIDIGAYEYQGLPSGMGMVRSLDSVSLPYYAGVTAFTDGDTLFAIMNGEGSNPLYSDSVKVKVTIDAGAQEYHDTLYVQRHYDIEPGTNADIATASVTLYFTQNDFTNYDSAAGSRAHLPESSSDTADISNIVIHQYHGTSPTGKPGTYTGSFASIVPSEVLWNSSAARWEITFLVDGFSGFFVTTNNADSISVQPSSIYLDSSLREYPVVVTGYYNSGSNIISENLTNGSTGTIYAAQKGNIFKVTNDGIVMALKPGIDTLIVTNNNLTAKIPVIVDSNYAYAVLYANAITFDEIQDKVVGDAPFALEASANSNDQVQFTLISGPATLQNGVLTITGMGKVTVEASDSGNIYFAPAANVYDTFCVSPPTPSPIVGDTATCTISQTYTVTAFAGAKYEWTVSEGGTVVNNGSTAIINWNATGKHTITVTPYSPDSCYGGSVQLVVDVTVPPTPTISSIGDSILVSSTANYHQWYFNNVSIAGEISDSLHINKVGFYQVETASDTSCWASSLDYPIIVTQGPFSDSLKMAVYPNPSNGSFNVDVKLPETTGVTTWVSVYSISGTLVYQTDKLIFFGNEIKIPITLTAKGTYIIKVYINGEASQQTLINM